MTRIAASSDMAIVALADPSVPMPSGTDQDALIRILEALAHESQVFYLVSDDPVHYRLDVWATEDVPEGVEREFEPAGGTFGLNLPSGQVAVGFSFAWAAATAALVLTFCASATVSAREPTTGYAPVNGLRMYYEIHGKEDPVVLLHGSFMTITNNWTGMIGPLSKSRQVIAVEMQGHGRTADINREFSYENLADDIAALLYHLKLDRVDVLGYSMGGGVAMQVAIRHADKVRKVVSISAVFRHDGWVKEAVEMFPRMDPGMFTGSPIEIEYRKLSPTPDQFETFVRRVIQMDVRPYDFGAGNLKATKAPMLFIHGDADGVRLDHIAEMFRLKGDEIFGDMRPRSESRLAILPNTTHITLMEGLDVVVPMVNDFLDAHR